MSDFKNKIPIDAQSRTYSNTQHLPVSLKVAENKEPNYKPDPTAY